MSETSKMSKASSRYVGALGLIATLASTSLLTRTITQAPHKSTFTCIMPRIFVGVFTDGSGDAKYAARRAALRATWFPNTTEALEDLECTRGITLRFVVGKGESTNDTLALEAWHAELKSHDDFIKLDVLDTYRSLPVKTALMFRHVLSLPKEYQYTAKIDDDMYVSLAHLSKVAEQWAAMDVDYVGCMSHPGIINRTVGHRWFEPLHDILASRLHMYACGHTYALSRTAMTHVFKDADRSNRFFTSEDQSMGTWMLAHNVTYFDDRRLCADKCHSSHAFAAVHGQSFCNGLEQPLIQLPELHATLECHATPPSQLPFLHSPFQRFNKMIEGYELRSSRSE